MVLLSLAGIEQRAAEARRLPHVPGGRDGAPAAAALALVLEAEPHPAPAAGHGVAVQAGVLEGVANDVSRVLWEWHGASLLRAGRTVAPRLPRRAARRRVAPLPLGRGTACRSGVASG